MTAITVYGSPRKWIERPITFWSPKKYLVQQCVAQENCHSAARMVLVRVELAPDQRSAAEHTKEAR
jgi:hypothetical protein